MTCQSGRPVVVADAVVANIGHFRGRGITGQEWTSDRSCKGKPDHPQIPAQLVPAPGGMGSIIN